jgi:sec-independent protein translocase protein TatC
MPIARKSRSLARNASGSDGPKKPYDPEEFRAPLSDHLDELRSRIIRSLTILVTGWVAGWFVTGWMNDILLRRIMDAIKASGHGKDVKIVINNVPEAFMTLLKQSFVAGLVIALPFITWQIWGFIAPGLKDKEKKPLRYVVPVSVTLFFIGVFFCYLILPAAFVWFASFLDYFPEASLYQSPGEMVSFSIKMMGAFGVCFQLPLVVYALGSLGILTPDTMMKYWRQATVFIFFVAAAITPSNDPISMLMMAVPLCILFAGSVYAVKFTVKKRAVLEEEDSDYYPALDWYHAAPRRVSWLIRSADSRSPRRRRAGGQAVRRADRRGWREQFEKAAPHHGAAIGSLAAEYARA